MVEKIRPAGAILWADDTPEALGDIVLDPNHFCLRPVRQEFSSPLGCL